MSNSQENYFATPEPYNERPIFRAEDEDTITLTQMTAVRAHSNETVMVIKKKRDHGIFQVIWERLETHDDHPITLYMNVISNPNTAGVCFGLIYPNDRNANPIMEVSASLNDTIAPFYINNGGTILAFDAFVQAVPYDIDIAQLEIVDEDQDLPENIQLIPWATDSHLGNCTVRFEQNSTQIKLYVIKEVNGHKFILEVSIPKQDKNELYEEICQVINEPYITPLQIQKFIENSGFSFTVSKIS